MPTIEEAKQELKRLEEGGVKELTYLFVTTADFKAVNSSKNGYSKDETLNDEEISQCIDNLQGYLKETTHEEMNETIWSKLNDRRRSIE